MLVTYTRNGSGLERIYLGSRASIEVWIEPADDGTQWSVRCLVDESLTYLDDGALKSIVDDRLVQLARRLEIAQEALETIPFKDICALHTEFNIANRRAPMSRKLLLRQGGFVAHKPSKTSPLDDDDADGFLPVRRAQP